ncbi:MAG: phosphate ABC transporter, permease protein PstA [Deltaproteobacteria bacterium RBG_13_65_10]|nr:MAG: phosphate ABC transporter, permease protein PstA [Deltaproteobacteria bacterium RBG_13_65_10]
MSPITGRGGVRARKIFGRFAEGLCTGTTVLTVGALAYLLGGIAAGGWRTITWDFLTKAPENGMTEGGIFPAIFGTISLTVLMILMALPLGVSAAIYLNEYAGHGLVSRIIRAAVNNLAGVPSIVFGLFGLGFFILFVGRGIDRAFGLGLLFGQPAMLWAAATLAILVLPVIIVATEEALLAVPASQREAAYAVGATKWEVLRKIVLPQARSGILTGAILGVARGAGETAPLLFTGCAYFLPHLPVVQIPHTPVWVINPFDQFMQLSYHVFIMSTQSHNPTEVRPIVFGTALVLVSLTFLMNLGAILWRRRYRRLLEEARV